MWEPVGTCLDQAVGQAIIQPLNFGRVKVTFQGEEARDLGLLEEIERDPDTTQANLAARLGVAVGTVNWHLRRMINKGYVKVKRAERRKLRYIITPAGLALRARLTVTYIEGSMRLYRETRQKARRLLAQARQRGFASVRIDGKGELAEICRLTCLEQGVPIAADGARGGVATLAVVGRKVLLRSEGAEAGPSGNPARSRNGKPPRGPEASRPEAVELRDKGVQ
jgi:DNA-binding MarR family transcriptional regulator